MDNETIDGLSMDIEHVEQEKLRSLFPQCFVDGQLSITKLMETCGIYDTVDENDREKYEFRWKGKQLAQQQAGKRSAGTLRPCPEESVHWDTTKNIYIEGDNLEVLKLLQRAYFRKVKFCYIDPPYNTGNDFIYNDDFTDPIAHYKEITSQTTKSNPETMGRFHAAWLDMMWPRLRLAANLLRDDGVIFISIDDNEVHNLRKICDEVFGEEHFIGSIGWESKTKSQNTVTAFNKLQPKIEYILVYTKHDMRRFNLLGKGMKEYPFTDEQGEFREHTLELMNATGIRGRESMVFDITDGVSTVSPLVGKQWKLGQVQVATFKDRGDLLIRDGKVIIKMRPDDERTEITEPFWAFFSKELGTAESAKKELNNIIPNNGFETVKPIELIKRMIYHSTDKDSIILDFFSGSATTAHAVMQLNAEDGGNRQFIMVQLPEPTAEKSEAYKAGYKNIAEIGKERIRRAGAKIISEQMEQAANDDSEKTPLDVGFKVFKFDYSNLKQWDDSPISGDDAVQQLEMRIKDMLDIIKPDRSEMDIVYEVMLKLGQELTLPVMPLDINGKTVFGVGTGNGTEVKFIVCFAPNITPEDAEIMSKYEPGRIIFANACFGNSEEKTNVKLNLRDKGIAMKAL